MWTENFQMYNLDLEKAEEPKLKLLKSQWSTGSLRKQGNSKNKTNKQTKNYFCFIDYSKAFNCMDHNKLENS